MSLTNKSRFNLIKRLKTIYGNDVHVLERAGFTSSDFDLSGSANNIWTGIVTNMELRQFPTSDPARPTGNVTQLEQFLQYYLDCEHKVDDVVRQSLDELKNNYVAKLKILAKAIKADQCVLFLGPNILTARQNNQIMTFNEMLSDYIVALFDENTYYDKNMKGSLSYVSQILTNNEDYVAGDQGRAAKVLYDRLCRDGAIDTKLHEKLAELPFKLIINTNPDEILPEILNSTKVGSCVTSYYTTDVLGEKPVIPQNLEGASLHYNLLGSIYKPTSIQVSESQLINFTTCIISGNPSLDNAVRLHFNSNTYYLFLGFDFDEWYMKLVVAMVLAVVKKSGEGRAYSTVSSQRAFSSSNKEFYEDEFKFYFINENNLSRFLKTLVDTFKILP